MKEINEVQILNLTSRKIVIKDLKLVSLAIMKHLSLSGELSLVLAADAKLRSLNRDYRGQDRVTDVLTFPTLKNIPNILGEIFINLADCERSYKYREVFDFKPSRNYLIFFLLIHGLLHLAGYSDEREKDRLEIVALGKKLLEKLIKEQIISV